MGESIANLIYLFIKFTGRNRKWDESECSQRIQRTIQYQSSRGVRRHRRQLSPAQFGRQIWRMRLHSSYKSHHTYYAICNHKNRQKHEPDQGLARFLHEM